nr:hypothetical protein [Mycoplasmopsis bovis]
MLGNNEPFFQGRHGSGTEPDSSEGGNSYPTGLTSLGFLRLSH